MEPDRGIRRAQSMGISPPFWGYGTPRGKPYVGRRGSALDSSKLSLALDGPRGSTLGSGLDDFGSSMLSSLSGLGSTTLGSAPDGSRPGSAPDSIALSSACDCSVLSSLLSGLGRSMLGLAPVGSTIGSVLDSSIKLWPSGLCGTASKGSTIGTALDSSVLCSALGCIAWTRVQTRRERE
jgi:hypothetical protein